jgi:hypothetical protein
LLLFNDIGRGDDGRKAGASPYNNKMSIIPYFFVSLTSVEEKRSKGNVAG